MSGLDLLPALGRALDVVLVLGGARARCCGAPADRRSPPGSRPTATVRPPRSGVSPFPGPADTSDGSPRPSRLGAATHRPTITGREACAPRTGAGPRAPWARLTTIPAVQRPVKAGSLCRRAPGARAPVGSTPGTGDVFPDAPATRAAGGVRGRSVARRRPGGAHAGPTSLRCHHGARPAPRPEE